jgi:hypothetical protein
MGETGKIYMVLVGKIRKETTWKNKAYMGRRDQNGPWGHWLEGVDWIRLAQDRD